MAEEYLTDDEQFEAVKHAFVEYAPWLIGGVLVGAALFFGYRYYQSYTDGQAYKAAGLFGNLTAALQGSDRPKSRHIAEQLIHDYPRSPYADQAQLTLALLDVEDGRADQAIAPLTKVMTDSKDLELRQIARLRLARIQIDQGKPDSAIATLGEPAPAAFAALYHDVRGDAYVAKKDGARAAAEYQAALAAADAGGMDGSLLELKILDLGATAPPAPKTLSMDILNKAKP
jgi:predicted negative regulator of RcsB-dependent stress response